MIIRSQDKKVILNFDKISALMLGGTGNEGGVYAHVMADVYAFCLGRYSTEERALAVLDEIQKAYEESLYTVYAVGQITQAFTAPVSFQMPPDEVEVPQ